MKVFLTGGTGFIGLPLTRQLLARDWQVTALVRDPDSPQARSIAKMGAALLKGDVTDQESMRPGISGADLVVHNAGWYEFGVTGAAAKRMFDINVQGTDNVLGLAKELSIPRTVYVSSIVAFGDTGLIERDESFTPNLPQNATAYTKSKAGAHDVAIRYQKQGLPLVTVCPGQVIGPNDHAVWGYFSRLYINHLMPPMGWGKEYIQSHVQVDDLAEGIALAAEKGITGEVYFLSGDSLKVHEVISLWGMTPGGLKVAMYLPNDLAFFMMALLEPIQRMLGIPAFLSRESVLAASIHYNFSNQKACRELGWNPRPAREAWPAILEAERELSTKRKKSDLVSLLKPME